MKKMLLLLTTAFACSGVLLGCSGSQENESPTPTQVPQVTAAPTPEIETEPDKLSVSYKVDLDTSSLDDSYKISDTLYGLFLEDINYSVDAGLYAEMIKNRSFEYGTDALNENMHGWAVTDSDLISCEVIDGLADESCLNENNAHYAVLTNSSDEFGGIGGSGYLGGIAVAEGCEYNISLFVKGLSGYSGDIKISVRGADDVNYGEAVIGGVTQDWQRLTTVVTATGTANENLRLYVEITKGQVMLDMISMMPADTYKGLPIRKDIGEYLEALNPTFLRFPGGCVIEGRDLESMYSWKDSIGNGLSFMVNGSETVGDVAARPQGKDLWTGSRQNPYYTTYGLGFYEYFELCEALDCLALPILNAGMTCPIQSANYTVFPLSSDEFKQCVQDALDLVEFCLGDETTYWGNVRIKMGHEETFNLKYIGIGNEQWQSEYHAHYERFVQAFEAAAQENPQLYGDIELIVANGPSSGSTEGWGYIEDYPDSITTLVDEHYYESPSWFLTNTKRYDAYSRDTAAKVFLGEYAAQSNTLNAALAEAAFMTGLERNSDVVKMACYAPLLGNYTNNQWVPDMIYFSNNSLFASIDYYVQQLFSTNVGVTRLKSELETSGTANQAALSGRVGLGSWQTSVSYDNLLVTSNADGAVLLDENFDLGDTPQSCGFDVHTGTWKIEGGALVQTNTAAPKDENTGDAAYVGDITWTDYTMSVDATILGGNEGFLIPVCVLNEGNNIFWNVGGWSNTVSCLQIVSGDAKSGQVTGTVKAVRLRKNQAYNLKVVVTNNNIKCYIDDVLYVDYTQEAVQSIYETASIDENGDLIIKLVNVTEEEIPVDIALENIDISGFDTNAVVTVLKGDKLTITNNAKNPYNVAPQTETLEAAESFTYNAPMYSVSIIRVKHK